ncbi:TPA: TIGR03759 family integrating conjugative element protein [Legionella pneumophila]|nr:TIGR03759 family integrating conjugative element protein [Legionella pneumophila]MDW9166289.1 TIGR03759 family integrating conjugative element protein [Legionella pneumophila subsp. fraseri]MDX1845037.1 TIGR03759 family integrating conjugative element protein [Legionella pneumophila subsp. fraseri]HAT1770912.1 TIGR03759 family integrating conjugative element protein [Legionella pneumophila]HAT2125785.1 TIGR03759 family integrating conjugative element protein [Legionella pneumophila]HAT21348
MFKLFTLTIGLLLGQQAIAGLYIPGIATSPMQQADNALAKTGLAEFHDEVIEAKDFQLNDTQRQEAKVWGLSEQEEKRYLQLMQSRSGVYYKNLRVTPIDILGLNARDDAEREHFANLAARQEAQKVAQNIAWNNAFYKAYNELFKDVPVVGDFDPSPYSPYAHQPIQLKAGETLYFFIKHDDAVTTILLQLIDAINRTPDTKLNLLFLDMDNNAIQLWANKHQIPIQLVTSQQITLNPGNQQFEGLALTKKQTPLLLLANGKISQIVDLGRF